MKQYKNVITNKPVSFDRYIVLSEYYTKEEAEQNLNTDVAKFIAKYKNTLWYKYSYPFAWATIREVSYVH